jgi:hypothetical protein
MACRVLSSQYRSFRFRYKVWIYVIPSTWESTVSPSFSITRTLKLGCYRKYIWIRVQNRRIYEGVCNFVIPQKR